VSADPPELKIADYGMGNLRSVAKAFEHVGVDASISADPAELGAAGAIVLPGVGAFPEAMREIDRRGLGEAIRERAAAGVPLLGICLGMQLLFERSDEFIYKGRAASVPVVGVMEVSDGHVKAWREYMDLATMSKAMGA